MVPCDFSAGSCFPMVQQRRPGQQHLLGAPGQSLCHGVPRQHFLPDGSPWQQFLPYSYSPRCCQHLCHSAASLQSLRHGAPASNKPHLTEKSTPVWLAIWRIWARFANSQHRNAAFATPDNICAHSSLLQTLSSCSYIANLSAHLHRLPKPPPYLRRMRLSPGRDAGVRWVIRLSPGWVRRSCKSPRARILVLGTSGAH